MFFALLRVFDLSNQPEIVTFTVTRVRQPAVSDVRQR